MYDFDRRVFVRSLGQVGTVAERGFHRSRPRRAFYVIEFDGSPSFMTGPSDLRPADYLCDGCSEWRAGSPYTYGRDGEYEHGLAFCFLCAGPPIQEKARRAEEAALAEEAAAIAHAEAEGGGFQGSEAHMSGHGAHWGRM